MASQTLDVHGVDLPAVLTRALESGAWTTAVEPAVLAAVFPDEPEAPFSPRFYSLDEMRGMTPQVADPVYAGVSPDDLDPQSSVWIGELALDRPFALDFRTTPPCVRFLTIPGRWVRVSDSVDDFLVSVGKA